MAALEPLFTSLQLAGLPCAEFKQCLEQACLDTSTAEVLRWLGSAAAGKLDLDTSVLQKLRQGSELPSVSSSLQPSLPSEVIALLRQQEAQDMLEPDVSELTLQQSIKDQENSLLQLQDQLKALQRISSAATAQSASSQQAVRKFHQQNLDHRCGRNRQHFEAQQAALNIVLQNVQETADSLCTQAEQNSNGGLLALSDLTSLQRESAALHQEVDRCIF